MVSDTARGLVLQLKRCGRDLIALPRPRRVVVAAAALLVVLGVLVAARQASDAKGGSESASEPVSVFGDQPANPAEIRAGVTWLRDPDRAGRPMEPTTREDIAVAYAHALAAVDRADRGDPAAPLADHMTGPALEAAREAGESALTTSLRTISTFHVRHELRLDFYSDDGSVVVVTVPTADVVRVLDSGDGSTIVDTDDDASRVVMVLDQGDWHIRQIDPIAGAAALVESPAAVRPFAPVLAGLNTTTVNRGDPTWRSYEPAIAERDLDAAARLGAEALRIFVAGPEFGEIDLDALRSFMDLAAMRGLAIVPTLFDGSAYHGPDEWRDDREYVRAVVGALADHPAIVLWDLKNEPDRDDRRSGGRAVVDAWLERVAADVRALDPDTPVTVGWSRGTDATRLLSSVDVVSFHHFEDAPSLAAHLDAIKGSVGERPVLVSELGRPSYVGLVRGHQPTAQAERLASLLDVVRGAGVGHLVWQLRDPAEPNEPGYVAGRASLSYGLLRHDFSERPIADVFRSGTAVVPSAGAAEWIRGRLPSLVPLLFLGGAVAAALFRVRRAQAGAPRSRTYGPG